MLRAWLLKIWYTGDPRTLRERSATQGIPIFSKRSCDYGLPYRGSPYSWGISQSYRGPHFHKGFLIFLGKWGLRVPFLSVIWGLRVPILSVIWGPGPHFSRMWRPGQEYGDPFVKMVISTWLVENSAEYRNIALPQYRNFVWKVFTTIHIYITQIVLLTKNLSYNNYNMLCNVLDLTTMYSCHQSPFIAIYSYRLSLLQSIMWWSSVSKTHNSWNG